MYALQMSLEGSLILERCTTNRTNAAILFAVPPFVFDPGEIAGVGPIAKLPTLERSDAFVFVQVKRQSRIVQERGRADRAAEVVPARWIFRRAMCLVHT